MVYSKGQTTSFPKSISRTGMSIFFTQVSILFGVDMHDVISCITDAHQEYFSPGPKPRTCLSNGAVYNALHGMISKRLLNTNMTNIKDAARKYEKKIKGERRMFKRFNIWVVFVNFLKPFHGDPHKISPSAFH
uniref:Transposase n=1 Tax=Parastrongyloides trichosuri TaxID=131310 RepID=A0A0N4ZYI9_PARTI